MLHVGVAVVSLNFCECGQWYGIAHTAVTVATTAAKSSGSSGAKRHFQMQNGCGNARADYVQICMRVCVCECVRVCWQQHFKVYKFEIKIIMCELQLTFFGHTFLTCQLFEFVKFLTARVWATTSWLTSCHTPCCSHVESSNEFACITKFKKKSVHSYVKNENYSPKKHLKVIHSYGTWTAAEIGLMFIKLKFCCQSSTAQWQEICKIKQKHITTFWCTMNFAI